MRIVFLASAIVLSAALKIREGKCSLPLGMASGKIADDQISASSAFDDESTGPQNARLFGKDGGGAWCPKTQINSTSTEWLQIILPQDTLITAVETQGRDDRGFGVEFAPEYRLEYWRPSLDSWARYVAKDGGQVLAGNVDTRTPKLNFLDGAILARRVRFVPVSTRTRTVCMRVELHGCEYQEKLQSYSMPEGSIADGLKFTDSSYDGRRDEHGMLQGGLGKLFDSEVGSGNFEQYPGREQVALSLTFSEQVNISSLGLHVANNAKLGAEAFAEAELRFSHDGINFSPRKVFFSYVRDVRFGHARWIRVPIQNRIAKVIQVVLTPSSQAYWLLLSEIDFTLHSLNFDAVASDEDDLQFDIVHDSFEFPLAKEEEKTSWFKLAIPIIIIAFCLVIVLCAFCRLFSRARQYKHKSVESPDFERKHIHVLMNGGSIKRASPSTYQMTKDNTKNALLEQYPLDSEYADPDFTMSTDAESCMPLLSVYHSSIYGGSLPISSQSEDCSAPPMSPVVKYADYGRNYYHAAPEIDPSQLHFVRTLEGTIFQRLEKRLVAVKSLDDCTEMRQELQILGSLKHPNVMEMIGLSTGSPFFCVLEYLENGTLDSWLRSKERIDTKTTLQAVVGVVAGLSFLESHQIVVGHLTAHTCMVDKDSNVKIAKICTPSRVFYERCCKDEEKARWDAPEVKTRRTSSSDMWSFGVLCWEVFGGCRQQPPLPPAAFPLPEAPLTPCGLHTSLITACWATNPANRPSCGYAHRKLQTLLSAHI